LNDYEVCQDLQRLVQEEQKYVLKPTNFKIEANGNWD